MGALDLPAGVTPAMAWAAAAALAALFVVVLAWRFGKAAFLALAVIAGLALAAAALTTLVENAVERDRRAERQAIERRADALLALALAPQSPLACLDAPPQLTVDAACEELIFGRPETVAAATAYVAAKLSLLADAAGVAARSGAADGGALTALRRVVEEDRFGVVAHVLASSAGCGGADCAAFALFADPGRIRTNLKDRLFDRHLARHSDAWPSGASASATPQGPPPMVGPGAGRPAAKPLSPGYDFPSAASIPAVSIMAPEPAGPPSPGTPPSAGPAGPPSAAGGAKPPAPPPLPSRKPPQPAPQAQTAPQPPRVAPSSPGGAATAAPSRPSQAGGPATSRTAPPTAAPAN